MSGDHARFLFCSVTVDLLESVSVGLELIAGEVLLDSMQAKEVPIADHSMIHVPVGRCLVYGDDLGSELMLEQTPGGSKSCSASSVSEVIEKVHPVVSDMGQQQPHRSSYHVVTRA